MDSGTFTQHPALEGLPPLVRRQRVLERQILPLAMHTADEKAVREQIVRLLIAAGIPKSEGVTCNGYDVTHIARKGQTSLNADAAAVLFTLGGVDPEFVDFVFRTSEETGEPSRWATVKPSKGASVRAPSEPKKRMAKATSLRPRKRRAG